MLAVRDIYEQYLKGRKICTDSRKVGDGDLFVALKGDNHDGNRYALSSLDNGAAYAIVDDHALEGERLILVDDSLKMLQELASYHRSLMSSPVLGITGSNGKTTTKELVHLVLSKKYEVWATRGNYNNHIGLPLTILSAPLDTEMLIIEMGTNQPGDIQLLCNIGDPTHGVITNIGNAHLEKLIDRHGVLEEKGALYRHVTADDKGTFFLYEDDAYLSSLSHKPKAVIPYGGSSPSSITSINESSQGATLSLQLEGEELTLTTSLTGAHNYSNILTAAVIGRHFGVDSSMISEGIASYVPDNMRSESITTTSNRIVLDAYNANPSSMTASIKSFVALVEDPVLILGDMLELGTRSDEFHKSIIGLVTSLGVKEVYLVGPIFERCGLQSQYKCFRDTQEIIDSGILTTLEGRDILIKASRGISLERIVDRL